MTSFNPAFRLLLASTIMGTLAACIIPNVGIVGPDPFPACAGVVVKAITESCPFANCGGSAALPVDSSSGPPVARMHVGMVGYLKLVGTADSAVTCDPNFDEAVTWATDQPDVFELTPRPGFPHHVFVHAKRPGQGRVFAMVPGLGRADFAVCASGLYPTPTRSCTDVAAIVVIP